VLSPSLVPRPRSTTDREWGTLCRWVEAVRPAPREPLHEDEWSELARLRRENLQLKMERDILTTATAFFARQSE
jgi:transposase